MRTPEHRNRVVSGWLTVAIGIGVALVIWQQPQSLRVPAWVAYAAAAAFVFAGLTILDRADSRLKAVFSALTVGGLLVPGVWIAIGSGSRQCSFSVPFVEGVAPGAVCRIAFGFGSLVTAGILVALLVRAGRSDRAG
jgi:hypothetical protein